MAPRPTCPANGSAPCSTACARDDGLLDYERAGSAWPATEKPKLIIAGGSAYPRFIDFARIRSVADEVGAYFMVDMAHFAGLVAAGAVPEPAAARPCGDHHDAQDAARPARRHGAVATTRRSARRSTRAVFPGLQGGPLMHVIAGKAAAFGEALRPEFRAYQKAVVENAKVLAATLVEQGLAIVTGGTDCHLMLVDLRPKRVTGKAAEASLERAHITANKNAIPFDPEKPAITSGIRLGIPGRHHARLRRRRVPRGRPDDRRGAGRPGRSNDGSQRGRRAGGRRPGPGALRPLPDLSRTVDRRCAARSAATTTPR